ncbi:ZP domain-containing protein [Caenorhabditis elegans]|uniref:ZP domain-containing protein n=1 Tax=Caenorhabditis elegans TaxID=6239 RepID=Q23097_CAEEL|nr:ZP domain-containing protein [Caenorhabditis elegans]CAA95850.3 ZP domain-containing protein [Caenorhabditis elegans]|eukprot:NP_492000.2 CUTiclin-Like [Caenorhabditis elegans]
MLLRLGFLLVCSMLEKVIGQTKVVNYIDNSIIGTPKVICAENDLALDIVTSKPFRGNIFVKGRAKDKSCRQSYANNGTNSYSLPLGKCGMQRLRSANPRGVNFMVTVIVSFHPAGFITKNDRAFHVKCFYMEPDEIVTQNIDVSMIPTTELSDSMVMPKCEYSVRRDGPNGPTLTYANVGDIVFHVWECTPADMGMLVKKCFVTDGDGEDHAVVDFDGCATDPFLLSELSYDASLMRAHASSQVFKYADSNQLYFTCQIRLCQKQMGMCQEVTPPNCGVKKLLSEASGDGNRTKREADRSDYEIDVATSELLVLDPADRGLLAPSPFCVPRLLLPVLPLILITIVSLTVVSTALVIRRQNHKKELDIMQSGRYY